VGGRGRCKKYRSSQKDLKFSLFFKDHLFKIVVCLHKVRLGVDSISCQDGFQHCRTEDVNCDIYKCECAVLL